MAESPAQTPLQIALSSDDVEALRGLSSTLRAENMGEYFSAAHASRYSLDAPVSQNAIAFLVTTPAFEECVRTKLSRLNYVLKVAEHSTDTTSILSPVIDAILKIEAEKGIDSGLRKELFSGRTSDIFGISLEGDIANYKCVLGYAKEDDLPKMLSTFLFYTYDEKIANAAKAQILCDRISGQALLNHGMIEAAGRSNPNVFAVFFDKAHAPEVLDQAIIEAAKHKFNHGHPEKNLQTLLKCHEASPDVIFSAVLEATNNGCISQLRDLLEYSRNRGFDILNRVTPDGDTLLIKAANYKNSNDLDWKNTIQRMATMLFDAGAFPATSPTGVSPIDILCDRDFTQSTIVQSLKNAVKASQTIELERTLGVVCLEAPLKLAQLLQQGGTSPEQIAQALLLSLGVNIAPPQTTAGKQPVDLGNIRIDQAKAVVDPNQKPDRAS